MSPAARNALVEELGKRLADIQPFDIVIESLESYANEVAAYDLGSDCDGTAGRSGLCSVERQNAMEDDHGLAGAVVVIDDRRVEAEAAMKCD